MQTILVMRLTGVACLFTMGLHPALWRVTWFIVPIVLLRSGALLSYNSQPEAIASLTVDVHDAIGLAGRQAGRAHLPGAQASTTQRSLS